MAYSDSTRGNSFKLKEGRFRLGLWKKCFLKRVVKNWNMLLRGVVDTPQMEVLRSGCMAP